jgi:hypothetical protein
VFDHIAHGDSAERVYLIGVDGQPPTSHCPFRGCFRPVLLKGPYLSPSASAFSIGKNMPPTEPPDGDLASVHVQIKRAILFPRLPH